MKTPKVLLAMLLSLLFVVGCGVNTKPGNGTKIGQIVKINKQGMIRDTWEAELIRGGMNNGSGSFGTAPFDFTVESEDVAKKLNEYMRNQTEVIITYRMEGVYSTFRSDSSGHFLVSVEPVKTNSAPVSVTRR